MRGHFGLITRPPNKSKPLGEAPFALSTHFPRSKTSGAFTTMYTILASWLWKQTFIVSKIKSSQNGKILFVPTGESGPRVFVGLLAMLGEQFDYGDEICGAVGSVRTKQEKIALWTKNAANEAAQLSIGRQWKEFIGYKEDAIGFIFHVRFPVTQLGKIDQEEAKRFDRGAKNRYTV